MKRRDFVSRTAAGGLWAGLGAAAWAQAPAAGAYVEGQHYVRLSQPVGVSAPAGKIEVVEFFWYGCSHCYAFEPALDAWVKQLPADVVFRRVPVLFRRNPFSIHQRIFYTLEAMGQLGRLHRKVFDAIHGEKNLLDTEVAVGDFMVKNGVDRVQFQSAFTSFGVLTKSCKADQKLEDCKDSRLAQAYKIDGVPALGVQGRYYTSPALAGGDRVPEAEGQRRSLAIADQLIARVRKGG